MLLLVSLLAIIVPLFFLVILRMPALKGMALSAVIVIVASYFVWEMPLDVIGASVAQGIHKTLTILLILFGAVLLLNTLTHTGAVDRMNVGFQNLSSDMRIQLVIVGFLFSALLEGASGFGAPAVVIGPLLYALGFTPMAAVVLALVANSTPVPFGAVGTPLIVGLSNTEGASPALYQEVAMHVTTFDLFLGTWMPLLLISIAVILFGGKKKGRFTFIGEMIPWAFIVGLSYTFSAYSYASIFGPEFVSILAPLTGLVVATLMTRFGIFVPKNSWKEAKREDFSVTPVSGEMSLFRAWSPYIVVVGLLLMTRLVPSVKEWTQSTLDFSWHHIFGFDEITSAWQVLYSPGTVLVISALFALIVQRGSITILKRASKEAVTSLVTAGATLLFTLSLVQVFTNSGIGTPLMSMPDYIAETLATHFGTIWMLVAPTLGQLGTFITGSATVSTLTFSPIQESIALQSGLSVSAVLAGQMIGAAAGSMICVHSVVSASATVGLSGKEGDIIRKTLLPSFLYTFGAGIVGTIFLWIVG